MRILVTGGLGFIGSNFIHFILKENQECEIYNLDVMTYAGNPENLKDIEQNPRYHFIKGDICNYELEKLFGRGSYLGGPVSPQDKDGMTGPVFYIK